MSWLQDLMNMKNLINRSNYRLWYYKKELDRLEKGYDDNGDDNSKKEKLEQISRAKITCDNEKVEQSQFEEKYCNRLEKYEKSGIITNDMIEEMIKRKKTIHGIKTEINSLGDSKYDLEEEQKQQMDEIQERYDLIFTNK